MDPGMWWLLPGDLIVCVLAVLTPRRPFDAAVAASIAIAVSSLLLHGLGLVQVSGEVVPLAAAMAMAAIVVRQASRGRAVFGTLALAMSWAITAYLDRQSFA